MTRRCKKNGKFRREYSRTLVREGIRGKYAAAYRAGTNLVLLAPDVASAFPTAEAVNDALRMLMKIAGLIQKAPAQ